MKITHSHTHVYTSKLHSKTRVTDTTAHPEFKDIMDTPENREKYPDVFKHQTKIPNTPGLCYGGVADLSYQSCQYRVSSMVDLCECVVGYLDPHAVANQVEAYQRGQLDHQALEESMEERLEYPQPGDRYYETQNHCCTAMGRVETEDGRTIEFRFEMHHIRESYKTHHRDTPETRPTAAPLVVDLNGQGPERSQVEIQFDMDNDGEKNTMALLKPGNGFLALDTNKDGVINDGSELFGALPGTHGFEQLAAYDRDQNGWIDENDPIFQELAVWESTPEGKTRLRQLKDLGIGAICLQFTVNDRDMGADHPGPTIQYSGYALNELEGVRALHALNWV